MTIVEGDSGLIVIDPLLSAETAKAALDALLPAPAEAAGRRRHLHATATSTTTAACKRRGRRGRRALRARCKVIAPDRLHGSRRSPRTSSPATRWGAARSSSSAAAAAGRARAGRHRPRQGRSRAARVTLIAPNRLDQRADRDAHDRRRRDRRSISRPAPRRRPRCTSTSRSSRLLNLAENATPHDAQPAAAARRRGARRESVVAAISTRRSTRSAQDRQS